VSMDAGSVVRLDSWTKAILELVGKRIGFGEGYPTTLRAEFDGEGRLVRIRREDKIDAPKLDRFDS
jgi:hypothetical protein